MERARVVAQIMEMNARQLTLFDRQGRPVTTVGHAIIYNQPVFHPTPRGWRWSEPTSKKKPTTSWVIDDAAARRFSSPSARRVKTPAHPPGRPTERIAYVALRDGYFGR